MTSIKLLLAALVIGFGVDLLIKTWLYRGEIKRFAQGAIKNE